MSRETSQIQAALYEMMKKYLELHIYAIQNYYTAPSGGWRDIFRARAEAYERMYQDLKAIIVKFAPPGEGAEEKETDNDHPDCRHAWATESTCHDSFHLVYCRNCGVEMSRETLLQHLGVAEFLHGLVKQWTAGEKAERQEELKKEAGAADLTPRPGYGHARRACMYCGREAWTRLGPPVVCGACVRKEQTDREDG